jgi:hypothetical protein
MIRWDQPSMNNVQEVRLAINSSILQRFFGNGYYYYDEVPMVTRGEERLLLPSQQATFGALFLRFCVRLAKHQAQWNASLQVESGILLVVWILVMLGGILAWIENYDEEDLVPLWWSPLIPGWALLPLCLPSGALEGLLAKTLRGFRGGDGAMQDLVDEMAPLFREQGYHVDYVQDKNRSMIYPPLVFIRFVCFNEAEMDENIPLADKLLALQQQARTEYTEALITQRQERVGKKGSNEMFLCGIQTKTVNSLLPCIQFLLFPLAFIYVIILLSQSFHTGLIQPPFHTTVVTTEYVSAGKRYRHTHYTRDEPNQSSRGVLNQHRDYAKTRPTGTTTALLGKDWPETETVKLALHA